MLCRSSNDGYVSSLIAYLIDFTPIRIVVKSSNVPLIGSIVQIKFNIMSKNNIPKFPKIVKIYSNDELSDDIVEKFNIIRCLEGIEIKKSMKKNTYSLPDTQKQLLTKNLKYLGTYQLINLIIKQKTGDKIKLTAGKFILVENGANTYKVSCSNSGDNIYCSCPNWLYQRIPPKKRLCKHIKSLLDIM